MLAKPFDPAAGRLAGDLWKTARPASGSLAHSVAKPWRKRLRAAGRSAVGTAACFRA